MTALVIAAAVLGGTGGQEGATLEQFSGVLEPLAGEARRIIFALGFTGAALSAMIANATAGGTLLSDGLGWGNRVSSGRVRLGILGVLTFGATVTVLAQGTSPVQLIIVAQALTVIVAPMLGALLVILANNRRLMGDLRNRWRQNVVAVSGSWPSSLPATSWWSPPSKPCPRGRETSAPVASIPSHEHERVRSCQVDPLVRV
jgi:manganese transport protein